jgi:polar amino acid transport system substrate-binding protein
MSLRGRLSLMATVAVIAAACTGGGATPSPATPAPTATPGPSMAPESSAPASMAPSEAAATPIPDGLLDQVLKRGKLIVATDANYAPQSFQNSDGTWQGFDVDVATEIAKRLGVSVEFSAQVWENVTAPSWSGRWDVSVGSMTITADREKVRDFSPPYYFTPAQMTASTQSGITTLDGLAGKTVCVGADTTYYYWLSGQTLDFGDYPANAQPVPAGVQVTTQKTDAQCPQLWKAGRFDFEGFLSSSSTVDAAIAEGMPLVKVGTPVFYEPLAVAVDKSGPDDSDFMPMLDKIIQDMHADGTLSNMSLKWFNTDLTQSTS